jgi:hypothetical protein
MDACGRHMTKDTCIYMYPPPCRQTDRQTGDGGGFLERVTLRVLFFVVRGLMLTPDTTGSFSKSS